MGVEFQENDMRRDFSSSGMPKLARFLISKGMASDLASANKLQIIVSLIFIAVSIVIFLAF